MLHAKVNRKYKIYAVFKTGFFLNSLKKSKHLVFSVNTPFNYAAYRKINAAWIQIKLLQFLNYCLIVPSAVHPYLPAPSGLSTSFQ